MLVTVMSMSQTNISTGAAGGASGKPVQEIKDPWVRKIPWRRAWPPTPVFLPGESHGQRSLVGHGP